MRTRWLALSLLVCLATTQTARAQDWLFELDLSGPGQITYDGPLGLPGINVNFDLTNFVGLELIGLEFTILPNAGVSYGPGEFESIVFHSGPPSQPNDIPPWVPASIINLSTETISFSNPSGVGYQTLRYDFPLEPVTVGGLIQARFQIEWPIDQIFDLQITPIPIPSPASVALLALAGLVGCRHCRRRS